MRKPQAAPPGARPHKRAEKKRSSTTAEVLGRSKLPAVAGLVVFLVCVLPFLRVLGHGFVAVDDQINTYLNPLLNGRAVGGVWTFWRSPYMGLYIPVVYTAWALIHKLAGGDTAWSPFPFHLVNLILHACNSVFAFLIVKYLLLHIPSSSPSSRNRSRPTPADAERYTRIVIAAALGALVFGLHPLHVEPVGWVSGLKDVLCGTFSLIYLLLFVTSGIDRNYLGAPRFLVCLAFMALAVLSKPSAVVLPFLGFVLSLLIAYSAERIRWMMRAGLAVLFISVPAVFITAEAQLAQHGNFVAPLWSRPLIAADALAFYISKTVFPAGLTLSYGRTPRAVLWTHAWGYSTWIVPAAVALSLGIALRKSRSHYGIAWVSLIGFLFFCLGFLPVLGLLPFDYQVLSTVADRYAYVSLLGPALILSFVMSRLAGEKQFRLAAGAVMLLVVGLGVMSYQQTRYWRDTLTVSKRMLEVVPDVEFSQSTAGEAELAAGELETAATHLQRAFQLCEPSQVPDLSTELGVIRHLQGHISEAAELYNKAISLAPGVPVAQNNLGIILFMGGNQEAAAPHFVAAIRLNPLLSGEPYYNLAKTLEHVPGKVEQVRGLFGTAMRLQPGITQDENSLLWKLRQQKPGSIQLNTELRLMWPYGYPVPGE